MHTRFLLALALTTAVVAPSYAAPFPTFKAQQLDEKITVGYGTLLIDINGDHKPDIVVADSKRVIWFENPSWTLHTILEGQTLPDNVAIAPVDVNGDGKLDLILGAGWKGYNTKDNSTLQWLEQGAKASDPWTLHPIEFSDVSVHRIHTVVLDGKPHVVVAPLLGRGANKEENFSQTTPKLLDYSLPADASDKGWSPRVITDELHVTHNFTPVDWDRDGRTSILIASYEGIFLLRPTLNGPWSSERIGAGDQSNPRASRGASEVKLGHTVSGQKFIAAIEPWHGNQVVIYTPPTKGPGLWDRKVIDSNLAEGHGLWLADLDHDGTDDVIVCSRGAKPVEGRGVFVFSAASTTANVTDATWTRHVIDDKEIAAEDVAAADLNGDGNIDIVAVGRATHNIRIYWNQGGK